ncbi:MAG TPA: hypothetical protein VJ797_12945, partial [Burkholderiales bacterium]|nr:hypothetical protein [Burkholderiales bacterium]
ILKLIAGLPELSLAPEDIEALVEAHTSALRTLEIDSDGPEAAWVAEQVIAVAKLGERDPAQISELVVASVRPKRSKRG